MHDLSLGPPVDTGERRPGATHSGNCSDGVYGCHRCWNTANNGEGTQFACDWCKVTALTRVTQAWDERVLYALCGKCQVKNQPPPDEDDPE